MGKLFKFSLLHICAKNEKTFIKALRLLETNLNHKSSIQDVLYPMRFPRKKKNWRPKEEEEDCKEKSWKSNQFGEKRLKSNLRIKQGLKHQKCWNLRLNNLHKTLERQNLLLISLKGRNIMTKWWKIVIRGWQCCQRFSLRSFSPRILIIIVQLIIQEEYQKNQ